MSIDIKATAAEAERIIAGLPKVVASRMIGSATYLSDPFDVDYLVQVDAGCAVEYVGGHLASFMSCGEYDTTDGAWAAVRKGGVNIIVTIDAQFYDLFGRATEVCKALRLVHKDQRVAVCQIVRDGKTAEQVAVFSQHRDLLAWAYAKLARVNFTDQDDAMMLDAIKLHLEHGLRQPPSFVCRSSA